MTDLPALAFNAVGPALAESGDWLPLSVRQRVADAVLEAIEPASARRLLEEALHLRMYGERAPGGNETWRDWETRVEEFLRSLPVRRTGNG